MRHERANKQNFQGVEHAAMQTASLRRAARPLDGGVARAWHWPFAHMLGAMDAASLDGRRSRPDSRRATQSDHCSDMPPGCGEKSVVRRACRGRELECGIIKRFGTYNHAHLASRR
ncbi:hypothetical protein BN2475_730001 [Paraburkholderia ribeironis]|uniref:Uncharacterized protein n=1 Tax=Paraburkholderia ribeironis TaxID=1247936 RepID=A0A1N7SIZ9_9BURK|nr:hypothetical protein BN2475_730001 [Paraburkholderia ribeironis]